MKVPRKPKKEPEIPQASLSDISFLLLVFFLSTTTFDIKKGLGLVLPPPSNGENVQKVKLKKDNLAKIWINKDGAIALNKEVIQLSELKNKIHEMVTKNPDMVISLKTDRKSKYYYMTRVLDELRLAGAQKISLATN